MHRLKNIFILLSFLFISNYVFVNLSKAENLSLLFYNLENFSMGTDMPPQSVIDKYLSDEDKIKLDHKDYKAEKIAEVINGSVEKGPDIITLAEIHNTKSLEFLISKLNKNKHSKVYDLHYSYVSHSENASNSQNLALIYKSNIGLKVLKIEEHFVEVNNSELNRPILQSTFEYNKEVFHIFTLHLPSPSHPTKEREVVIKSLKNILTNLKKQEKNPKIIITGDFNTVKQEEGKVLKALNLNKNIVDMRSYADKKTSGTIFYKPNESWSNFDKFLVSSNLLTAKNSDLNSEISIKKESFKVITQEGKDASVKGKHVLVPNSSSFYPKKGQELKETGPSDHFPILMKLKVGSIINNKCLSLFL
ncbi:MAG: hypothetical protein HAW60_01650 [Bdellovibrionales bacterium]|nr:hypothetical protein [Bdellovibrionales bacterium]